MASTYDLLDFGNGRRLEQWGQYRLIRPDPTTSKHAPRKPEFWESADAVYQGEKGRGEWVMKRTIPEHWTVAFQDLSVIARLAPYKHTGIFPEQEQNWRWMRDEARNAKVSLKILNLFAYTGGATVALAKDGHFVTHVDAARPSIGWAKENAALNNIGADRIRWMLEDAPAFAAKELKRGKRYDAILLDPPAYGHGPTGKTWRVERDLAPLLEICAKLLSDSPVFLVLNGYAQNAMPESFRRLLSGILFATVKRPFTVETEPLVLRTAGARTLETGIVARVRFRNKK